MSPPEIHPPRPGLHGRGVLAERLRDRWADPRVRVGVLLAVAAVAGALWYQAGRSEASALVPAGGAPWSCPGRGHHHRAAGAGARRRRRRASRVGAGHARRAGGDAIAAAGGAVPEADLDRLNLAAKVADGQRILVERVGAAPSPAGACGAGDAVDPGSGPAPATVP